MHNKVAAYQSFMIEGTTLTHGQIVSLCHHKENHLNTAPWEKEIFSFISDFLSAPKTIRVTTSGSTGLPKTLRVKKENMIYSARMTGDYLGLKAGDKALLCLPARYIAGKMMIVRTLVLGLDLYYTPPSATPAIGQSYDFSAMTPMQVAYLIGNGDKDNLSLIRKLILGGGPVPSSLEKKLIPLPNEIHHTYGMTETLSHIAMRRINGPERSEWFTPFSGVSLSRGRKHNLIIHAPEITGKKDLITHDIVEFADKEHRQFRISGRTDHIINSGGIKIMPEEIERKLDKVISHPFFIGGIPDEKLGEKVALFIETNKLSSQNRNALKKIIWTPFDLRTIPRLIITVPVFKYTESGKIKRRETLLMAMTTGTFHSL